MSVFIFGFKPYHKFKKNITEEIIKKLRSRKNLRKFVFPTRFNKSMFSEEIEKHKPDIIIGLGQHPRAQKIRIERKAVNLKRDNRKEKPQIIEKGKPRYRFINLKLKSDKDSRVAYNAGMYVCNFCMYIISGIAQKKNVQFAFLHIPKDYNVKKATQFIDKTINEVDDER